MEKISPSFVFINTESISAAMETTKQVKCYYELLVQTTTEKASYSHTEHNSPLVLFSNVSQCLTENRKAIELLQVWFIKTTGHLHQIRT